MKGSKWFMLIFILLFVWVTSGCSSSSDTSNTGVQSNTDKQSTPAPSNNEQSTPTPSNDEQKTAEISWYLHNQGTPEDRRLVEEVIVKNFEQQNPNIKVKVVYNADPDTLTKQQLAAGAGPDIIMTDGPSTLKQYAAAGFLVPLDEYSKKFGWDKLFEPWAYDAVKFNGQLVGVPGAYETLVVYYNKDLFKQNGWDIPKSYEELTDLSKKIQDKGIVPFAFGSSDFKGANEWWLSLAYNETLGADEFKKVLKGETAWNSPSMEEATNKLVDLWKKGYISAKQSAAITIDNATTLFLTQKAAMKMEGTWLLSNLIDSKPKFDWGLFTMPAWKDGIQANLPLALGDATGINKNSKHPDAVATFLNYLNSAEIAKQFVPRAQFHPVNGVDIEAITDIDPHIKDAYQLLKDAINSNGTGYAAWTYWPPATETYAWGNIESVFYKQTDVKTYLSNAQKEFEKDKQGNKLFDFGN